MKISENLKLNLKFLAAIILVLLGVYSGQIVDVIFKKDVAGSEFFESASEGNNPVDTLKWEDLPDTDQATGFMWLDGSITLDTTDTNDVLTFYSSENATGFSIISRHEAEKTTCNKCGKLKEMWHWSLRVDNVDGFPNMEYCQECTIRALVWVMDNFDKEVKK